MSRSSSWLLLCSLTLGPTAVALAETQDDLSSPGQGMLLAAKKKKGGKKKKKADEESGETDFGPGDIEAISRDDADGGATVHALQEGADRPYLFEASGATTLSFLTKQQGEGDPTSVSVIDIQGELVYILGSIGVGPAIGYNSASSESSTTSTDPITGASTTETATATSTDIAIGGVFKYYFASVDRADLVPYAYGGFSYLMGDTKVGDGDASKTTGTELRFGGGVNFFLDSNVSFQPSAQYVMRSEKADAEGAEESTTSGFEILLGLGTFL